LTRVHRSPLKKRDEGMLNDVNCLVVPGLQRGVYYILITLPDVTCTRECPLRASATVLITPIRINKHRMTL
jgi:hypothetical protein